ncbi:uncharacterized protein LOC143469982 isoform X1 [Clavelina lepadiformis]|uniref:uncharacterized protein LOC143469982 isoform X1 n=1 Tax=Clavelina lepadiformis TaxID=159417 RepID=UPI0040438172
MNSETSSPVKSAKRVIIRIDPVPDVLNNDGQLSGTEKSFSYEETARYVTPDEEINGPPKLAMKSKRRQSLTVTTAPQSPTKQVLMRPGSLPTQSEQRFIDSHRKEMKDVVEEEEVLPDHHQVLYDLLGADKAESILNPKMEEITKSNEEAATPQRPIRRLPSVDTGLGADALWRILKGESEKKLQRMDRRIPEDWKLSYGAFLRDSINQNRPLVHRSFTQHSDVPELDKLLDERYKERVRKARHHANVMFRASENNKNKTTLLLNNNPVPDYNDKEGVEALSRYFDETIRPVHSELPQISKQLVPYEEKVYDDHNRIRRRFPNLHFLSENAARTRGTFYGRYAKDDAMKMVTDIPGYKTILPPSMTARVTVTAPVHDQSSIRTLVGQRRLFSRKAFTARRDPTWQPLTIGALMEYAGSKRVMGMGEFHHGQASRWKTPALTTA